MKNALIVHNPTAGDNVAEKDELIRLVKIADFEALYVSIADEGWENFSLINIDVLVLAGGDGTVRLLAKTLLKNHDRELNVPIALVPLGTANNIAKTLKSGWGAAADINLEQYRNFDTARIKGLSEHDLMLESMGFGAFPLLIHMMKAEVVEGESAGEKIRRAQGKLISILKGYGPFSAQIEADGMRITGDFLMLELMNIKSVGPSLHLAPGANPGDGYFDLVLIKETDRDSIIRYVQELRETENSIHNLSAAFETKRVKRLSIAIKGVPAHVDDELIMEYPGETVQVRMHEGTFKFLDFNDDPS
jgi:diacylglycerol kinase family enzyme